MAKPAVIGSLAAPSALPFLIFMEETSPHAEANESKDSKSSLAASNKAILWVVTSAPTQFGSFLISLTAAL